MKEKVELLLRYFYRLKCHLLNPAYSCVISQDLELFFRSRHHNTYPIISRLTGDLNVYNILTQPVLPCITPKMYSWTLPKPKILLDLNNMNKRNTPDSVMRGKYRDTLNACTNYKMVYIDGSKIDGGVGSAAVLEGIRRTETLPASIMNAELNAVKLTLKIIEDTPHSIYIIASDWLSSILDIDGVDNFRNHFVHRICMFSHDLIVKGN